MGIARALPARPTDPPAASERNPRRSCSVCLSRTVGSDDELEEWMGIGDSERAGSRMIGDYPDGGPYIFVADVEQAPGRPRK